MAGSQVPAGKGGVLRRPQAVGHLPRKKASQDRVFFCLLVLLTSVWCPEGFGGAPVLLSTFSGLFGRRRRRLSLRLAALKPLSLEAGHVAEVLLANVILLFLL